ncbi:MAG TPA: cyclodeaminase/cyclohydrolase family protein [Candidatus Eremiobacteraceae bacterium]|nr:cyclodeaminase/cyclohydrolase family protein [Candidatus Eremiobacteraceae bacterium]
MSLASLSLTDYTRKLASADPTPGGGSAAAAVAALAAGLVRMVAELTAGSPKFADVAPRATSLGALAVAVARELLACVDEDVVAFDKVSAAYKMPRSDEAQKAERSAAIQRALAGAAEPPLRVVELAERTCGLAAELVDFGTPNAVSDLGCAAAFALAAAQGAAFNVEINARSLKDRATAAALTSRARAALAQVDIQAEVVLGKVNALIAGGD